MAEIFGSRNHLETLIWKKSYGGGAKSKHIVNLHEYVVCYAKCVERIPVLELPPNEKAMKYYKFRDAKYEARGPYRLQPLATNSMDPRPNLRYAIPYQGEEIWPEKQWQWAKERVLQALADDELVIVKKKGKWTASYKQYLKDTTGEERTSKAYSIVEGIYTQQGTNEIKGMFGDGKVFSFPKPRALVQQLIQLATGKNCLVLDSFAGSGTTGHAVLDLNKADGGNRRFILVEMEESICQPVTAQRLTRAIEGYKDMPAVDGGFRYCRLGAPVFDETGNIRAGVTFGELAAHVYFAETGEPLPKRNGGKSAAIGRPQRQGGLLAVQRHSRRPQLGGGNVLTNPVLKSLPPHDGPRSYLRRRLPAGHGPVETRRNRFQADTLRNQGILTMLELRDYQKRSLDALESYFRLAAEHGAQIGFPPPDGAKPLSRRRANSPGCPTFVCGYRPAAARP